MLCYSLLDILSYYDAKLFDWDFTPFFFLKASAAYLFQSEIQELIQEVESYSLTQESLSKKEAGFIKRLTRSLQNFTDRRYFLLDREVRLLSAILSEGIPNECPRLECFFKRYTYYYRYSLEQSIGLRKTADWNTYTANLRKGTESELFLKYLSTTPSENPEPEVIDPTLAPPIFTSSDWNLLDPLEDLKDEEVRVRIFRLFRLYPNEFLLTYFERVKTGIKLLIRNACPKDAEILRTLSEGLGRLPHFRNADLSKLLLQFRERLDK